MFATLVTTVFAAASMLSGITGDLRLGEKYLALIPVQLKCGTEVVEGKTDAAGSFHLTAKGGGKCQVSVTYEKQTAALDVVLFDQPARYRLQLELKDGKYVLKRV